MMFDFMDWMGEPYEDDPDGDPKVDFVVEGEPKGGVIEPPEEALIPPKGTVVIKPGKDFSPYPITRFYSSVHDREIEALILGCMTISAEMREKGLASMRSEWFYSQAHLRIFEAIRAMVELHRDIDVFTLSDTLKNRGLLDEVGGMAYLTEIADLATSEAPFGEYVRIVREKAMLREMMETNQDILREIDGRIEDVPKFMLEAEQRICSVMESFPTRTVFTMKDATKAYIIRLEKVSEDPTRLIGVRSGFADLDLLTHGFRPGDLIFVAGRPGMGKTAFCLNVAVHASLREKAPAAFFSMEMSTHLLMNRVFASEARVDSMDLRRAVFPQDIWEKIVRVAGPISESSLYIEDSGSLTVTDIRLTVRRLKTANQCGIVFIDYLQLIRSVVDNNRRWDNRNNEVAEISRSLKSLAMDLQVPVVCISQLNREADKRGDKRPQLSDLRDSGALEEDADLVIFLYRPAYYSKGFDGECDRTAEAIVAKNRNGPTRTVELTFFPEFSRFENKSEEGPF